MVCFFEVKEGRIWFALVFSGDIGEDFGVKRQGESDKSEKGTFSMIIIKR